MSAKPTIRPQTGINPPPFKGSDALEYRAILSGLIAVLERFGGYEAAVDGLYVDQIARNTILQKKADLFLISSEASEHTFVSIADAKAKFAKINETANWLFLDETDSPTNQKQVWPNSGKSR